jgi:cytochrome P450
MSDAPRLTGFDPFAPHIRLLAEPDPARAAMRALGPIVQATAPAGGPVWIITDDDLAREALSHPKIAKDPALAPLHWDPRLAGLEQTAAQQPSLTTLDGPPHAALRRAHAPLLSAKRIQAYAGRVHDIAREQLTGLAAAGGTVDLMAGFTTRFPLTVLLDLLGIPLDLVDQAAAACRRMFDPGSDGQREAIAALAELAAAGLGGSAHGLAAELAANVPDDTTEQQLRYHLFALIFAGQLTTDAALGFLVADQLAAPGPVADPDALVRETLRVHPPAPYTLWRFTTEPIELGGVRLPARAPVLVDIEGVNTDPDASRHRDLAFGAGPHFCVGAQLAQLELRAVAAVLAAEFPRARLAVPYGELRQETLGGILGNRLTALPAALTG